MEELARRHWYARGGGHGLRLLLVGDQGHAFGRVANQRHADQIKDRAILSVSGPAEHMRDADVEVGGGERAQRCSVLELGRIVDCPLVEVRHDAPCASGQDDGKGELERGLGRLVGGASEHLTGVMDGDHAVVLRDGRASNVEHAEAGYHGWEGDECENRDTFASGSRQFIEVSRHVPSVLRGSFVVKISLSRV